MSKFQARLEDSLFVDRQFMSLPDMYEIDQDFLVENKKKLMQQKIDNKEFFACLLQRDPQQHAKLMRSINKHQMGHSLFFGAIRHIKACLLHRLADVRRYLPNLWAATVIHSHPEEWQYAFIMAEQKVAVEGMDPDDSVPPAEEEVLRPSEVHVPVPVPQPRRKSKLYPGVTDEGELARLKLERKRERQREWVRAKRLRLKEGVAVSDSLP